MQRYTILFITVDALHVSGGFSAHHQELKDCTYSIWYVLGLLLLPLAWLGLKFQVILLIFLHMSVARVGASGAPSPPQTAE
jgi:hypothetical protein